MKNGRIPRDERKSVEFTSNLRIVNVVATTQIGRKVDLVKVGEHQDGSYSDRTYRGNAAYIKSKRMKGKVTVFGNGKLISVGTKSEAQARSDIMTACRVLVEVGVDIPDKPKVTLQNIVATGELGKRIEIERLASRFPDVLYEPEQFPGAIYHAVELKGASVLVFASGKVVFAGLKDSQHLEEAEKVLKKLGKAFS